MRTQKARSGLVLAGRRRIWYRGERVYRRNDDFDELVRLRVSGPVGTTVDYVQGTWTVPAVNPSVTPNAYSAFWVGIDGYGSGSVEQIGTDSDVVNGVPSYYVWYEMYPNSTHLISSMTISPGDMISASVQYAASGPNAGQFDLSITDLSRTGDSYSKYRSPNGFTPQRLSASGSPRRRTAAEYCPCRSSGP